MVSLHSLLGCVENHIHGQWTEEKVDFKIWRIITYANQWERGSGDLTKQQQQQEQRHNHQKQD